ncbi:MAG: SusD/RagB family nutrient-binding outer membrane lipoprotein [Kosmotogaceae bacterium]
MKITKILILLIVIGITSCEVDYYEDPNEPVTTPPNTVFNHAVKQSMDHLNALFFGGGRFSQVTMQYWQQSEYGDEDRYAYRESMREYFEQFYYDLKNFKKVIELNVNDETREEASAYGDNDAQIACSRIMMAYLFNEMTNVWGPIPYWSYGGDDNEDFQALELDSDDQIIYPEYVTQEVIHGDILNELDEAYDQLEGTDGFVSGDRIYGGDTENWQKFANSLRLRIALKIKDVDSELAQTHIDDVMADGDYISNHEESAVFVYGTSDKNSAPYYYGVHVGNRDDFAVGNAFMTLLQGNDIVDMDGTSLTDNPFDGIEDPRIPIFAKPNPDGNYVGMPIAEDSDVAAQIDWKSRAGSAIDDKPDFPEVLMEWAEVEFILSELNDWDNEHYKTGVRANMERWNGVDEETDISGEIDDFVDNQLPDISELTGAEQEEHVLTQKYIALYMQANTAFTEYRRTGYPQTLVKPGDEYGVYDPAIDTIYGDASQEGAEPFVFNPIPDLTDLPNRMRYPSYEQTLNGTNYNEAREWLENGDAQDSPLYWDLD